MHHVKLDQQLLFINSNVTHFYQVTVTVNKFSGSCNAIVDPCDQVCVPNKIKNMNVKVLMLG